MQQEANRQLIGSFAALTANLSRKLLRARMLSSRTEELLDDITCSVNELKDMVKRGLASSPDSGQTLSALEAPRRIRRPAGEPAHEAVSVILIWRHDGSAVARVDSASIPLPPNVAALLEILVADRGFTGDHLVGWKSVAEIFAALKERTRHGHSKAAVKELVYRLRGLLERHGASGSLVRSHRRLGYRFAVLRGAGTMLGGDNP